MRIIKGVLQDIQQRKNLDFYITAIVAIAISIFGVVGNNQVVVSSAILTVLALISVWLLQNRRDNEEIRQLLTKTDVLHKRFEELSVTMGSKVTFIPMRRENSNKMYQDMRELISGASHELLVLDYNPLEEDVNETRYFEEEFSSLARANYYREFVEKVRNSKPGEFKYQRIIQLPRGRKVGDLLVNDLIFRDHCETICRLGEQLPVIANLKYCGIIHHGPFLMVDRKVLVFDANFFDYKNEEYAYSSGYFYIDDPFQNITRYFLEFFERADAISTPVKSSDLSEISNN